jgi:hypothetical protein
MNTLLKISLGIGFLALQAPGICFAQKKKRAKGVPAAFVLMQLNSESNRITALEKDGKYAEVEEVKKDAQGVTSAVIKDFKDHFTRCPVYFYSDTNLNLIKERNFNGVLLDTNLQIVTNPPLHPDSKDYLVIYYGRPARQSHYNKVLTDTTAYRYDSGEPFGRGLVASNYKLQQLRYIYWIGPFSFLAKKGKTGEYNYFSKHFDIEYYPLASRLNKELPLIYEK